MGRMTRAVVAVLGLLAASCTTVGTANDAEPAGLLAQIPFEAHGPMIVVPVSVDGSDPLRFIFDTGAGGTVISARTAERLGIVGKKTVSREGAAGAAEVTLSPHHTVSLGSYRLRNVTLGIADLDHIDRRSGMRVDGVVGWAILSRCAVRLDYDDMQIQIYDPRRYDRTANGAGYDLEVSGTVAFLNATVVLTNGAAFSGRLLVDTGFGGSIAFDTPFARENGLLAQIGPSYARVTRGVGLGGTDVLEVHTAVLSCLEVGSHEFTRVPARIYYAEAGAMSWPGVMGILGNDVLKRLNMLIDVSRARVFLEPDHLYHEPFEIDCSGLELAMDDSLRAVLIEHVYADSPAHEAGLQMGDEIVRIDGANTPGLSLPEIRSALSQDGKEVEIVLERAGELQRCMLRLRTLIRWP